MLAEIPRVCICILPDFLLPTKERPQTSAIAARRLIGTTLGISTSVSNEKRLRERQQLKDAKGECG